MKTPKRRGPSPRTTNFTALDIMSAWEPLLEMRSPGFEWDGSSAIPDELYGLPTGVAKYIVYKIHPDKLVDLASTGFPAHNDLSSCSVWRADQCVSGSCVVAVLGETSIDCRWLFAVEINSDLGLQRRRFILYHGHSGPRLVYCHRNMVRGDSRGDWAAWELFLER